jgi:hypothetical protein
MVFIRYLNSYSLILYLPCTGFTSVTGKVHIMYARQAYTVCKRMIAIKFILYVFDTLHVRHVWKGVFNAACKRMYTVNTVIYSTVCITAYKVYCRVTYNNHRTGYATIRT